MNPDQDQSQKRLDENEPSPAPIEPRVEGREASYFEKLIAFIPADLIAAYLAVDGITKESALDAPLWLYWAIFGALLVLTPLYVIYRPATESVLTCTRKFRALVGTLAFATWVFALGGPFAVTFDWYRPVYGSLLLVIVTLTIPVLEKIAEQFKF